jgi:hypothetical protein
VNKRCGVSVLLGIGALLGASGGAFAQGLFYDSFSTALINAEKWQGFESGPDDTEVERRIVNGQAQLLLRTAGSNASDSGFLNASNRLRISHRALIDGIPRITMMEGRVTVFGAGVATCAANPTPTHARAQVIGAFFNDGTGNNRAGDRTSDVFASLQKTMSSVGGNHLDAFVLRCTDPACSTTASVVTAGGAFTRSWVLGQPDTMNITWNSAANNFAFTVSGTSGNETVTLSYTVPDTASPKRFFNDFSNSFALASCTAGAVSAFLDTRIDNVRLNPEAMSAAP